MDSGSVVKPDTVGSGTFLVGRIQILHNIPEYDHSIVSLRFITL